MVGQAAFGESAQPACEGAARLISAKSPNRLIHLAKDILTDIVGIAELETDTATPGPDKRVEQIDQTSPGERFVVLDRKSNV